MSARSAIIVTTSSKKDRLQRYLDVGDIELTEDDVKAIDHAGAKGEQRDMWRARAVSAGKWTAVAGLAVFAASRFLEVL